MSGYSEDALVERPAIALFGELGWETANVFNERFGATGTLGRETPAEVVLAPRLRAALRRLNPTLPAPAIEGAIEQLTRDRGSLNPAHANREIYRLSKDGVKVGYRDERGAETVQTVRVIDWDDPARNDFFLAAQLWVAGEMYKRRADLVGFVNGLPLVFVELKATHRRLEDAYNHNLRDYKATIPQLFWYNAVIILSNGSRSRIGSMTAPWEHFVEWKRINGEGEAGIISLDTMIRGTCERERLLDLVENFTLFDESGGTLVKLVAKNHQYLGVNNATAAVAAMGANRGRLGVFWHTQGSGKSYSMVFFAQKILRKAPGNWTFLIVTDRQELDDQIYKTFAGVGAVTERQVQAESGEHLRRLLREDHRTIFTLIQKFRTERGATYPVLSARSDIIVIADEAHRSQYDVFALNMRNALPNAAFIGFTGTPLMTGEEKTREVFGDYVSIYNFKQSIDDGATVPLYYENRIPELQLTNEDLDEDMEALIEEADLDEAQQRKLQREFARQYHLITRDDRLDTIAADIVAHFMGRGQAGKAMVVSIDKETAVRMYDRVQIHWQRYLAGLRAHQLGQGTDEERAALAARIAFMECTDMAVVVSPAQNEVEEFRKKGLDIATHRRRMVTEALDVRFKDPDDPLRLVFVCAMWMTGFDAPSVSTIYLDKPMRNHTLMQTIARANRVFAGKLNGTIVDYVGVFRDLQKALAIYGTGAGGSATSDERPVKDKSELVGALEGAIAEMQVYCGERGIDPRRILEAEGFARVKELDDAVEAILVDEESRNRYFALAAAVEKLYRSVLPSPEANRFGPLVTLFSVLTQKILAETSQTDITDVMAAVEELLDRSVAAEGYVIRESTAPFEAANPINLGNVDLAALQARFAQGRKHTAVAQFKGLLDRRLRRMVQLNRSRAGYLEKFQQLIDAYNRGVANVELFFQQLVALTRELDAEERRAIAEALTEEELAVFDLLTRPDPDLTGKEREQVKKVARQLLATLKREKLVLDWRKHQQTRARVLTTIKDMLDQGLPEVYTPDLYERKCDSVYQHIYESYYGQGASIYGPAA